MSDRQQIWQILTPLGYVEPGWRRLRWRPIKHRYPSEGTWNIYFWRWRPRSEFQLMLYRADWNNGWGRSKKVLRLQISIPWIGGMEAWIAWNHMAMDEVIRDGAQG